MESLIGVVVLAVIAVPVLLIMALVQVSDVRRRVRELEAALAALRQQPARASSPLSANVSASAPAAGAPLLATSSGGSVVPGTQPAPASPAPTGLPGSPASAAPPALPPQSAQTTPLSAASPPRPALPPAPPREPPRPNPVEVAARAIKRWFTVGNVPVKIGMLVLLAGVAALLKYANDQGWLQVPIALRLAGISAAALAGLVFAWRQRVRNRSFALAVQGGAIGVLLLVTFAAFKMYALIDALPAFAISVVLVGSLGVLAVLQDSRTLAVLGILAGFLAPVWLSTGSGNHVALFSYYALLNVAILAIAWMRPWRILNLLGFAFTWGIGLAWGVLDYDPAKYATTQPFLLLFFAFYLALPILYARRRPARTRDRIDGTLLFGTPLIAFSLQAALLEGARMPLAFCALGAAVLYAALAFALVRRERYAVLGQAHALLAVGFATLSVPLALSARATASVFALEGAGLAWLGLRQQRRLPQWSGAALQLLAAIAFLIGLDGAYSDARAVANATFMSALLIAAAGFASAWAYRNASRDDVSAIYYGWGLLWWIGNAVQEVQRFVEPASQPDALLAFAALTGWLAAEVHRRRPAAALALTTLAGFAAALPLAFLQVDAHGQPFAGNGLFAWIAFAALGVRSLLCLRGSAGRIATWAQFAWWLLWPVVLSLFLADVAERFRLAEGWRIALAALPWLAAAAVSLLRWPWLAAPLDARFDAARTPLRAAYLGVIGIGWLLALFSAGRSAPLPWMPLLNPLDLAQLAVLALIARWLWRDPDAPIALARIRIAVLAVAAFALVTVVTLRGVHHWGGVSWDAGLVSTSLAQTALTVVWSVLGVAGWVAGSRRGQRTLWLAGAVLMGVVLAKLVLVDRSNLGNLLGIGAFIAYGLLCTLIGWLAPAPPRAKTEPEGVAAA